MDVDKALQELYEEKQRLDMAIAALEQRLRVASGIPHRGRKSMSPEQRLQASRRMLKYWEARRAGVEAGKDRVPSA